MALFAATVALALASTSSLRHRSPAAGWVMVLLPSSPWLLFWLVTTVAGFSRWGSMRFVLAGASPLLIWQGLRNLAYISDAWVPLKAVVFWTRTQGALELLLALAGLASLVSWGVDMWRAARGPQAPPPTTPG